MSAAQKITPFLWLDGDVEEVANFYVSVFKDGRVESVHRRLNSPGNDSVAEMYIFTVASRPGTP